MLTHRRAASSLGMAAAALMSTMAMAGLDEFTITDGTVDLTLQQLSSGAVSAGLGSLRTQLDNGTTDHLFQNWFWFRATGDSRERALSNQIQGSASGNSARLVYAEASNDGANPDALIVELNYTIHDLSNGGAPRALLVIAFKVQHLQGGNLNVQFFNYNDVEAGGDISDDTAVVTGADEQTQLIVDGVGDTRVDYSCSATNHINYEIGAFPNIRNQLTDANIDNLGDTGSPFGPGDYTGANQWGTTLGSNGSSLDTLVGSVAILITRDTCPADTDNSGAVDVTDLLNVITGWGVCP